MADASEHPQPSSPGESAEALSERLRRIEQALSTIQVQSANASVTGGDPGMAGMLPTALLGSFIPGLAPSPQETMGRSSFFKELRLMFRMYFDARYRLSRLAQFGAPAIIILAVFNYLVFMDGSPWHIPVIAQIFERVFLIVLSVALYKILSREVARYQAVLAYLARYTLPTA